MRALFVLLVLASSALASSWPGVSYTEVRAYSFNRKGAPEPIDECTGRQLMYAPLLNCHKALGPSVINKAGAPLTSAQVRRLLDAVTRDHHEHLTARCFDPRHGFIFYDAEHKAVASIEVCFECGFARGSPDLPRHSYDDMETLRKLCKELKLPDPYKTNQSLELTATRRTSTFPMTKTLSLRAVLALGGGSSALSR
jgi:hypothetical protein